MNHVFDILRQVSADLLKMSWLRIINIDLWMTWLGYSSIYNWATNRLLGLELVVSPTTLSLAVKLWMLFWSQCRGLNEEHSKSVKEGPSHFSISWCTHEISCHERCKTCVMGSILCKGHAYGFDWFHVSNVWCWKCKNKNWDLEVVQ